MLTRIENARRAFLLTLTERDNVDSHVARSYVAEKVAAAYRAHEEWELVGLLDLESQRTFRRILAERPSAPVPALPEPRDENGETIPEHLDNIRQMLTFGGPLPNSMRAAILARVEKVTLMWRLWREHA